MPVNYCEFEYSPDDTDRQFGEDFFNTIFLNTSKQGKADFYDWLKRNFGIHHVKLVNLYNSRFGYGTNIGSFTEIGGATIGRNCSIQAHVFIPPGTIIEDRVFLGPRVTILNDKHPKAHNTEWKNAPVAIRNGASVGGGAILLPGIVIGEDAVVGAGAVVTKSVLAGDTVVGNPARSIKKELCSECNTPIIKGGISYCPRCTADLWEPLDA